MFRAVLILIGLFVAFPAFSGGIAVVDFQRAVNETEEGKAAQDRLNAMFGSRSAEIERLGKELESEIQDYQAKLMILSEESRMEREQTLAVKQQRYEATLGQYQNEMQQTYYSLLQGLDQKMRAISAEIAKEKSYDIVLDKAVVVHAGAGTIDMTDELIKRYNSQ